MSRRARVLGVLAVIVLTTIGADLLPAGAAAGPGLVATGWWSRNPAASAPAGGMAVGAMPDGAATVAAIQLELGPGVTAASLDLTEAGGTGADVGGVVACESASGWQPVEKGAFDAAPATSCADKQTVVLARDATSLTWSVDLLPLLAGRTGPVSVVLVPAPSADANVLAGVTPFEVQWSGPPVFNATAASTPTTAAPRPSAPAPAPAMSSPVAVAAPASALALEPVTVSAPVVASAAPAAVPAASAAPVALNAAAPLAADVPLDGDGSGTDRPYAQALFFIAVSAATGVIAGAGRWFFTSR